MTRVVKTIRISVMSMLWAVLVSCAARDANAQIDEASRARLDYAVPDHPAQKILNVSGGTILRPTSMREMAVTISDFIKGGILPSNFAAEFAPWPVIVDAHQTIAQYEIHRLANSLRVSIATAPSGTTTRFAAGIRFSILDESDFRADPAAVAKLTAIATEVKALLEAPCEQYAMTTFGLTKAELDTRPLSDASQQAVQSCLVEKGLDITRAKLASLREVERGTRWDELIWDVAVAFSGASLTGQVSDVTDSAFALWTTLAMPIGKDVGQFVVGLNGRLARPTQPGSTGYTDYTLGIAGRLYLGSNEAKVSVDFDAQLIGTAARSLGSVSVPITFELKAADGMWLDASLAINKVAGETLRIVPKLNMRFATAESTN